LPINNNNIHGKIIDWLFTINKPYGKWVLTIIIAMGNCPFIVELPMKNVDFP